LDLFAISDKDLADFAIGEEHIVYGQRFPSLCYSKGISRLYHRTNYSSSLLDLDQK